MNSAVVVGSGVIGLTTAIELARRGISTEIVSRTARNALAAEDASDKACSIWYPILVGGSQSRNDEWSWVAYNVFSEQARESRSGVQAVEEIELIDTADDFYSPPRPIRQIPDFRFSRQQGPVPPRVYGVWRFTSYVIAMPQYLAYLEEQALQLGVKFTQSPKLRPEDVEKLGKGRLILNCSGLGSRELFFDSTMRPVKGHLLFFDAVDLKWALARYDYAIMPRPDALAVGVLFLHEYSSLEPETADRDQILATVHEWQDLDVLGLGLRALDLSVDAIRSEVVGLRPYRPGGVRLELVTNSGGAVIHNYGHGGSGVSLSWGCAREAAQFAVAWLAER